MLIKVTTRFPYWTQLPEDVATNTLYFLNNWSAPPDESQRAALQTLLNTFYTNVFTAVKMSPVIVRSQIRALVYDNDSPEPRAPIADIGLTLGSALQGTSGTAEELAICMSFQAPRISGESQARRRGRIYLGPLDNSAFTVSSSSAFTAVPSAIRTGLTGAMQTLRSDGVTAGQQWSIWSRANGESYLVTNGWVDNALDVQRRRGNRTTVRTTWAA